MFGERDMFKALYVTAAATAIMMGAAAAQTPSAVPVGQAAPVTASTMVLTTDVNGLATIKTETSTTETAALPASDAGTIKQTTTETR